MSAGDQYPGADVPDISADWYRETLELAHSTPSWLHTAVEIFTEAGVVLLAAFLVLAAWRARRRSDRTMALALLAPVVTVVAYGVSELSKSFIEQLRPCRALGGVDPLATCPPPGDWSFPSNHTTIVAAAAIGVLLTWRWLGALAVLLAVLVGYSRVFLGVHYPHDVLGGFLLGAIVAAGLALLLAGPATRLVRRLRAHRTLGPVLLARDAATTTETDVTQVLPAVNSSHSVSPTTRMAGETQRPAGRTNHRR